MEKLTPIIRKSIQSDTSVRLGSLRRIVQISKFLSIDKQLKYIFQALGYDSIWVSVKKEKIVDLIFPAIYVKYAENENENNNLILVTKHGNNSFSLFDLHNKYVNKKVDLTFFSGDDATFFLFEKKAKLSFDESERQDDKFYGITHHLWPVIPFSILVFFVVEKNYLNALIGFTGFTGIYIFYMLLCHHFMKDDNFVSSICSIGRKNSCEKVLNYRAFKSKIFDFKLLGLIYFSSLSLSIVASFGKLPPYSIDFIAPIIMLGILGVAYSLYVQAFKVKAFCKVCLICSSLILVSAFLFFFTTSPEWTASAFLQSFLFISLGFLPSFLFYNQLEIKSNQISAEASLTYFKSDTDIFKHVVSLEYENNLEEIFGDRHFEYGDTNADNTLCLIISLNCQHCYHTLGQLVDMIDNSTRSKLKIWIASNDSPTIKETSFLNHLVETSTNYNIREFYKKLSDWYVAADKPFITSSNTDHKFVKGVNRVPVVLVENKILPHFYSISDLKYLLS